MMKMMSMRVKKMKMNKRGDAVGENVLMIYRLILITASAFVILGASNLFYSYDINVRNVEAQIIERNILHCMSDRDITKNIDFSLESTRYSFLDVCGFSYSDDDVYAKITFIDRTTEEELFVVEHGNSGAAWVAQITRTRNDDFDRYAPGYSGRPHYISFRDGDTVIDGIMDVEVFVHVDS